jgi:uncharacterized membrane protein
MNLRQPILIAALLNAGAAAIALWAYLALPSHAMIAINWHDLSGRSHGAMPKLPGLAILPAISVIVTTSLAFAPLRARDRSGFESALPAYGLLITSLAALFLVAEGAIIALALDPTFDVIRWVFLACAVLLVLVGNTLGKVRHNGLFGVRTRATRKDARVWDKTQRFTGRVMVIGAVALAAISFFAPDHRLLIAALVAAAAGPIVAGSIYARALPPHEPGA